MKVFLDDIRDPPDNSWTVFRSADNHFYGLLHFGEVTAISLDHDLGEDKDTGYDVICFLERLAADRRYIPKEILIHTANPVGRKNMEAALRNIQKIVTSNKT